MPTSNSSNNNAKPSSIPPSPINGGGWKMTMDDEAGTSAQLNNLGARLLRRGQHGLAIDTLCQALAASKRLILSIDTTVPCPDDAEEEERHQAGNDGMELNEIHGEGAAHSGRASPSSSQLRRSPPADCTDDDDIESGGSDGDDQILDDNDDHDDHSGDWCHDQSSSSYPPPSQCDNDAFLNKKFSALHRRKRSRPQHFIFRNPVEIPPRRSYYSKIQYAITCMFNLALAHHLWAIDGVDCPQPQHSLDTAKRLYELAYNLMMQPEESDEICVTFSLAIVNNLGYIHRSRGDASKAKRCFEHLLSTLMFFGHSCEGFDNIDGLDGFFSTVLPLMVKDPITARAA
eukprot:CAMPEP_0119562504 /NCGR_PEP_ID=MMETSP1352-20130426/20632_1 /TAXON_ID=265584 /ORGANISM="Stauroneis constricta, Strain CCMP1120" /LENGTH=343 /DNA_ID=CAMNT_0007610923 /DNA_START=49 /DNA_END=1080 /DNA_ORIENTATION=+